MNENTTFRGTHPQWQLQKSDLLVVAREPFDGALSALRTWHGGVVVCDLASSLPFEHGLNAKREAIANGLLIAAAHDLAALCDEVRRGLRQALLYGPRRGRLLERIDNALARAFADPEELLASTTDEDPQR